MVTIQGVTETCLPMIGHLCDTLIVTSYHLLAVAVLYTKTDLFIIIFIPSYHMSFMNEALYIT